MFLFTDDIFVMDSTNNVVLSCNRCNIYLVRAFEREFRIYGTYIENYLQLDSYYEISNFIISIIVLVNTPS